jgi:solute:Na+ symporter, SSS family
MRTLDLIVIAVYLLGITWFGRRFKESQKSLKDYFLGGREAPWWAIGFSIVSAETSTLTVIGTPALAFRGDLGFLQVVFGYLLARLVIISLFLPHYFRGEMYTAYELMERQFGRRIRSFTAGTFLILRALAEGVRVFAISMVVGIVLNLNDWFGAYGDLVAILLIVALTLIYTFEGGMTAVIWTDVVQMFLYVAGAIVSFVVLLQLIPGGWSQVVALAEPANKLRVFNWMLPTDAGFFGVPYTFWGGLIGGAFLTTASHGTEQLMVQRLLAAKSEQESRWALLSSWLVILFQFTLFLLIGLSLWVYYGQNQLTVPAQLDRIYPQFIWNHLPPGIAGLVIAAVLAAAMSNLSAALNSLASTSIMDFLKPWAKTQESDEVWLGRAKMATVFWAVVLFVIGWLSQGLPSVLEAGLRIASVLYGALLGVFLLGLLTKSVREVPAMIGMGVSVASMLVIWKTTNIGFTWYVVIGTAITMTVGVLTNLALPVKSQVKDF